MDRRSLIKKLSLTALTPFVYPGNSVAQEKISRIIVGFPPGGGTDVAARLLVEKMRGGYPQRMALV
jgi:tripartite-type tricarboxylate transporter receptor subunit TctC